MPFSKRFCWITGVLSLVLMAALAPAGSEASSMAVMKAASKAKPAPEAPSDGALTVNERVSRMTDAEARTALIDTLSKQQVGRPEGDMAVDDLLRGVETGFAEVCRRMIVLTKNLPKVPGDLAAALRVLGGGRPVLHFFLMALIASLFYGFGYAVEWGAVRWFAQFTPDAAVDGKSAEGWKRAVGALLFALPNLFGLFLFAVSSAFSFLLIFGESRPHLRLFMLSFLAAIVLIRFAAILSRRIFAPRHGDWRLVPVSDDTAAYIHRWTVRIIAMWAFLQAFIGLFKISAMPKDSFITVAMFLGTLLLAVLAVLILKNREPVSRAIRGGEEDPASLTYRFGGAWHTFALAYLFVVWLFGFLIFAVFEQHVRGAFIMSLLIVPIYLAIDRMGQWLLDAVIDSFQKPSPIPKPKPLFPKVEEDVTEAEEEGENPYVHIAKTVTRVIVFLAVAFWFMDIWGVGVAFAGELAGAAFDVFLTVLIAYLIWVWGSRAIDNRILKSMKAAEAEGDDQEDDEWGGAATQDRFYTLLPLFRKSLAVVLVVMVSLISLSAIGINIGPLLAGAGVVGLALGFGAQRLVRDILSGIFFLLDDTFRIGEYVDCGGVSGTVEEISLRMVKLRHHRGMLQFVPFGDIKQVTNSMRGGIVVKFNMQFPYDTDIDKVRKIIKKVGQKMMLDEKMGPDFIKPLKSQGVREIGDSVMTIRAKFTARPGAHFVIRREAYRRITEALAAKGIHYAHKTFIVDMPEGFQHLLQQPVPAEAKQDPKLGKAGSGHGSDPPPRETTRSDTPPAPPTTEGSEPAPAERSAREK
ncbi:MAG: mechanosensitive ion channel family protein [Desulfobacterales bacterium]|jgi:small-conductance mechanosensitive channel